MDGVRVFRDPGLGVPGSGIRCRRATWHSVSLPMATKSSTGRFVV